MATKSPRILIAERQAEEARRARMLTAIRKAGLGGEDAIPTMYGTTSYGAAWGEKETALFIACIELFAENTGETKPREKTSKLSTIVGALKGKDQAEAQQILQNAASLVADPRWGKNLVANASLIELAEHSWKMQDVENFLNEHPGADEKATLLLAAGGKEHRLPEKPEEKELLAALISDPQGARHMLRTVPFCGSS